MTIEHLMASLQQDAEAEAGRIVTAAEEEAANLARALHETQQGQREAQLARQRTQWDERCQRAVIEARRHTTKELLSTRERLLELVLERVRARFPRMIADPRYQTLLGAQLREAMTYVGDKAVTATAPAALTEAIRATATPWPNMSVRDTNDAPLGMLIQSDDGVVSVDCTLDTRLRQMWPQISIEVLEELG